MCLNIMISVILTIFLLFILVTSIFIITYYLGLIPNTHYFFTRYYTKLIEGIIRSNSCNELEIVLTKHKLWKNETPEHLGWVDINSSKIRKINISKLKIEGLNILEVPINLKFAEWTFEDIKNKMNVLCAVLLTEYIEGEDLEDSSTKKPSKQKDKNTTPLILTDSSCISASRASKCMIGENNKNLQMCTPFGNRVDGCCYRMIQIEGHPIFSVPTCVPIGDKCQAPGKVQFAIGDDKICRPRKVCPEDRNGKPIDPKKCKFLEINDPTNIETFADTYRIGGNKCVASMFPPSIKKDNKVKLSRNNFIPSKECVSEENEYIIPEPNNGDTKMAWIDSRRIPVMEKNKEICF